MRIISWNINSVRLRLPLALRLLAELQPDVLCLQETKCPDDAFPMADFAAAGYAHQHFAGMKSYNGVAIISRQPITTTATQHWHGKEDCRHIHARLHNGIELHNVYVPAGGDIPDTTINPKFAHKLGFLAEQTAWWARQATGDQRVLVGDLNIAPLVDDVWSHKQLLDVVSHTPIEVAALTSWMQSHEWVDAMRMLIPPPEKLYTWWSYRAQDWQASNRGRRLDHVWVTPTLRPRLQQITVLREARDWQPKPSDHVPVVLDLTA